MSNNFVFTYTVVIYAGEEDYRLENGLLTAYSFTDAVEQISDFYDTDLARIVNLAPTDNEMIVLPANVVYNYARGNYDGCTIPCDQWGNELTESTVEPATEI